MRTLLDEDPNINYNQIVARTSISHGTLQRMQYCGQLGNEGGVKKCDYAILLQVMSHALFTATFLNESVTKLGSVLVQG